MTEPRRAVPLSRRPLDIAFIVFFVINLAFITYIVDLEQLMIADPAHFDPPLWPPFVGLVHWWGRNFDPLLMARPPWWRATIWIDNLLFGPFYAAAIYAYAKGRDWIRLPSILWAAMLMTNVVIIMFEETVGPYKSPAWGIVALANAAWFVVPLAVIARMWRHERPFTGT